MSIEGWCDAALEQSLMATIWLGHPSEPSGADYGDADGAQYNG